MSIQLKLLAKKNKSKKLELKVDVVSTFIVCDIEKYINKVSAISKMEFTFVCEKGLKITEHDIIRIPSLNFEGVYQVKEIYPVFWENEYKDKVHMFIIDLHKEEQHEEEQHV